jgi:hypothetical protein
MLMEAYQATHQRWHYGPDTSYRYRQWQIICAVCYNLVCQLATHKISDSILQTN